MATAFTHAFIGAALAPLAPAAVPRRRLVLTLALLAALPDLDVVAFALGIPYSHPFGHRGFSHSLFFAGGVALLVAAVGFRDLRRSARAAWWRLVGVLGLATASHGLLDAFTDAGLGIGLLIPFSQARFFSPWRPLETSPLSVSAFFEGPTLPILANEVVWVWLPVGGLLALALLRRRLKGTGVLSVRRRSE